jgi:hypothetical protein
MRGQEYFIPREMHTYLEILYMSPKVKTEEQYLLILSIITTLF